MSTWMPPDVPGYDVTDPLGAGASATVWRGRRRADGLAVALKVVRPADGDVGAALREAGLLAGLRHQHVVHLFDVLPLTGPGEQRPSAVVLVTQLAEGGSLAQVLARRALLSPGELVTVLQPVAGALADLHQRGVVHGDLSTGNVLFLADGMPLLADLGTARVAGERAAGLLGTGAEEGMVAPEVLEGFPPTRESDVYQLGALAWLCLVGREPGPGYDRPPLAEVAPVLGPSWIDLISRCMAPQPEDRPDAEELAVVLLHLATPEPVEVAPDTDPAQGLTQRLRQVAQEDAAQVVDEPGPWWRRVLVRGRRAEPDGTAVGAAARAPGEHRPDRVPAGSDDEEAGPRASSPAVVVAVVLAVAVVGALVVGLLWPPLRSVLASEPAPDAPVAAVTSGEPGTGGDAAVDATAAPDVTGGPGAAGPTGGPAPGPDAGQEPDGEAGQDGVPGAPGSSAEDARGSFTELVAGRAAAWEATDPDLLGQVMAPGSPAEAADQAELRRARDLGLAYPEVTFAVQDVSVLGEDDDRVRVEAVVTRAPLEARDAGTWVLRAPEQTDRVEVELVRVDGRWLLWSWGEVTR